LSSHEPPNLVVVGAPKCATTSLHHYLNQHPSILMSNPKEPYWFGSDLGIKPQAERFAWPAGAAEGATTPPAYRGEASPGYLASMTAADEIHEVSSDAQIIIAVRDPIDVLRSLHGQLVKLGIEEELSFDPAIRRAHEVRGGGARQPRFDGYDVFLDYFRFVEFSAQIERWRARFPASRVQVVVYDDLKADAQGVMDRLTDGLSLPAAPVRAAVHNRSADVRSQRLARAVAFPTDRQRSVQRLIPAYPKLQRRLIAWNWQTAKPEPLAAATRAWLAERLSSEVETLGRLLGRDLSHWMQEAPSTP
jgi:hypothetical protein